MFAVYCHTSPSGKRYVGWTSQPGNARWLKHVSDARLGLDVCPAFHRAIRKYGADAFAHEVLEVMTTEAGAKRAEQLWIARLGTREHGYNLSAGGDGATGHVPVFTDEWRARLSAAHVGKRHDDATRAKMADAHRASHARGGRPSIGDWARGRAMSVEHRARIGEANRQRSLARKAGV
jgi:group I intron endonuclease